MNCKFDELQEKFRRSFQSRCHLCRRLLKVPTQPVNGINPRASSGDDSSSRHRVVTKIALQPVPRAVPFSNIDKTVLPQTVLAPGSEPATPETLTSIVYCTTQSSTAL